MTDRSDWSIALLAALDHLPAGVLDAAQVAAVGYMVRELEPGVEEAHGRSDRAGLDMVVGLAMAALPVSMAPLAGIVRMALQVGAAALWRALEADAIRVEADGSRLEVVVTP